VRLLLDTVILIYAVESPELLSKRAISSLQNPDNIRELSSISLAEIAIKSSAGKLKLSVGMLRQALEDLNIRVLPYTARHAFELFALDLHHRDPFDLQIIAQALSEKISIVTSDRKFHLYKGIDVIW
jgi:PIN domain nuclease of toxin-antitoxin system